MIIKSYDAYKMLRTLLTSWVLRSCQQWMALHEENFQKKKKKQIMPDHEKTASKKGAPK